MFEPISFIRSVTIEEIYNNLYKYYRVNPDELDLPASIFRNPMTLIPCHEVANWYQNIEVVSGDADFMFNLSKYVHFDRLGSLGQWFLSAKDLALTFRRFNYGMSCVQSGAYFYGVQNGKILKWTYNTDSFSGRARFHDSVRVLLLMIGLLRKYLGDDFCPLKVCLPYRSEQRKRYEAFFGCEVEWNSPRTELWLNITTVTNQHYVEYQPDNQAGMNFGYLDNYINMPQPNDHIKVIYELINYSCHFGTPSLNKVSAMIGLSPQQFQRRLTSLGFNFTNITGYVLCNIAAQLLQHETDIEQIAKQLGYQHKSSFVRTFKKYRGLTPSEYIKSLQ
ncbi:MULTISPECIES: AraC family transcriptional regulator [unclassified Vibrio]|uniref:AraC family transcriptional regulator n=1 Tax=unclassified Vibrio TaxID=2614977 RepID=UPI0014939204|nr:MULTISPECIES: AraC family transcriptional regulator [unclassified Vibrio]NOI65930.1 AraC family transcriptional regulator [Vibrio sp. 99-8-1]